MTTPKSREAAPPEGWTAEEWRRMIDDTNEAGRERTRAILSEIPALYRSRAALYEALREAAAELEGVEEIGREDGWSDRHAVVLEGLRITARAARRALALVEGTDASKA